MDIVTIPHLANLARRKYEALCLADLATVPPFPPTGNVLPE